MRNNIQAIFALVLLLTVSLFAQNMCIELCTTCQNNTDQTCQKVENSCHCTALLDSINAVQAIKDETLAEEKPVEEKSIEEAPVNKSQDTRIVSAQNNNFGSTSNEVTPNNLEIRSKKKSSNYLGFTLAYESPKSRDYYGRPLYDYYSDSEFGLDAGFVFRHYFNRFISFNFGINAVYHTGDYGIFSLNDYYHDISIASLEFNTIMAEIPLGFRFGIPLGSSPISLFISTNFHIRKPIYQWIELDILDGYWYDGSYDDVAASSDWEFIHLLGFGIELTRNFSLEVQWFAGNFRVYKDSGEFSSVEQGYENGNSWHLKMEVVF
ncbi:MAG: hypothetical protein II835_16645 [Fibrobacter sp.]|nr:hypothetical protein [Fibrobacter sp.]